MKISKPSELIHQSGLMEFNIEQKGNFFVLTAGTYKQTLKRSDYEKICALEVKDAAPKQDKKSDEKKSKRGRQSSEKPDESEAPEGAF